MKLVCPVCERSGIDSNLSCTEINCPLDKHLILGSGQVVGDVKVVQLLHFTKNASYYEGLRKKQRVILKVAHLDSGSRNQLISEARFLTMFALQRLKQSRSALRFLRTPQDPFPGLPNLLSAYGNGRVDNFPHGQTQLNGKEIIYTVWDFFEGLPLSQYLDAVSEPWFDAVAHLTMRLARVLNVVNQSGVIHGKLTPDAIWVREDNNGILRPTIIDFGLLRPHQGLQVSDIIWLHEYSNVAYIAPEIIHSSNSEITAYKTSNAEAIDVYGLGLLFYEMLAGKPKFNYRLRSRSQMVADVRRDSGNPLNRDDIMATNRSKLLDLARNATRTKADERSPKGLQIFANTLEGIVGKIPPEKQGNTIAQTVWRIALVVCVIVGVYLIISATLTVA
jgi:serine/threonine protein kinase